MCSQVTPDFGEKDNDVVCTYIVPNFASLLSTLSIKQKRKTIHIFWTDVYLNLHLSHKLYVCPKMTDRDAPS